MNEILKFRGVVDLSRSGRGPSEGLRRGCEVACRESVGGSRSLRERRRRGRSGEFLDEHGTEGALLKLAFLSRSLLHLPHLEEFFLPPDSILLAFQMRAFVFGAIEATALSHLLFPLHLFHVFFPLDALLYLLLHALKPLLPRESILVKVDVAVRSSPILGVSRARRERARSRWARHANVGRDLASCLTLSSSCTPADRLLTSIQLLLLLEVLLLLLLLLYLLLLQLLLLLEHLLLLLKLLLLLAHLRRHASELIGHGHGLDGRWILRLRLQALEVGHGNCRSPTHLLLLLWQGVSWGEIRRGSRSWHCAGSHAYSHGRQSR
mmetsp:Transcript_96978/g.202640  ORF Transcript_96978/g.202640 Transcript_96978/m.202640 type:complete len:322 (+) Transcript_96978:1202-2167(+)